MPFDLERELDELHGVDLDDFVAARNELSKQLRGDGRKDEAEQVKQLPKPTVSAWTVNQLAREERRQLDLLLDAGHRLRQAQSGLLRGGDPQELDQARDAQRDALRKLNSAARRILEARRGAAPAGTLDRVAETLRAASVTESGRELLARGRLAEDVQPGGFEQLAALAPEPRRGARSRANRSGGRADTRKQELAAARDELKQARARQRELDDEARRAEREADKARRAWEGLQESAERARAEAEEAASAVAKAQERLDDATQ